MAHSCTLVKSISQHRARDTQSTRWETTPLWLTVKPRTPYVHTSRGTTDVRTSHAHTHTRRVSSSRDWRGKKPSEPAHASAFHHQRMCQFSPCCIPKSTLMCVAAAVAAGADAFRHMHAGGDRACVHHIYFSVLWIRVRFYDAHVVWLR